MNNDTLIMKLIPITIKPTLLAVILYINNQKRLLTFSVLSWQCKVHRVSQQRLLVQVYMPWNTSGKDGQDMDSQLASSHRPLSRHSNLKYFLKVTEEQQDVVKRIFKQFNLTIGGSRSSDITKKHPCIERSWLHLTIRVTSDTPFTFTPLQSQ